MTYFSLVFFLLLTIASNVFYFYSSRKFFIVLIAIVLFVIVLATRTYSQPDFNNYKAIYESLSLGGDWLKYLATIEIGFLLLLKMFSFIGLDYYSVSNFVFLFICVFFSCSAILHRNVKNGEAFLILFLIFSSYYFYFLSLNVIRQGLAISIFSIAYSRLISSGNKSIFLFLLSSVFHYSAFLLFVIVFVFGRLKDKVSISTCLVIVFVSFVFGFFDVLSSFPFPEFLNSRIQKLKGYSASKVSSYAKLSFYFFICIFYYILVLSRRVRYTDIFFYSSGFLSFLLFFMHYGELLDRLVMYSIVFSSFIFIDIYRMVKPVFLGNLILFLYCFLSYVLVFFSSSLNGFFL